MHGHTQAYTTQVHTCMNTCAHMHTSQTSEHTPATPCTCAQIHIPHIHTHTCTLHMHAHTPYSLCTHSIHSHHTCACTHIHIPQNQTTHTKHTWVHIQHTHTLHTLTPQEHPRVPRKMRQTRILTQGLQHVTSSSSALTRGHLEQTKSVVGRGGRNRGKGKWR